mgnify:CR=1 FL=1
MWFTLQFEDEQELQRCIQLLQKRYRVTGELSARRLDDGRWELQVVSERRLRESVLERLPGQRVED